MKRAIVTVCALAAALPLLQGCFPLAVTGVGAAALMASDRRTSGMYIEDEAIEWKAFARLREFNGRGAHVNPTSFNRHVLLTGQAPTEDLKKEIEAAVRRIENVREVTSEISIAGASSLASRGNDALITSNVKARMVNNGKFSPNHVKVLTEANTVYLMGLVTPAEGDAAVEIARTTQGVSRVVKVFEYLK
ncbi:MAG TPA: BON domain-containing protein [Usitatibacter sp.]|nr:BON domain-containing protein [Usitatibacter sp.]